MSASYGGPKRDFRYSCDKNGLKHGGRGCQSIGGSVVDAAVVVELLRALESEALELSCQAAEAARHQDERLHRHWRQRLDRAGYDADLARRRYEAVDPDNRLVARTLETQWEAGLRHQRAEQAAYDAFVAERPQGLTADQHDAILALAESIHRARFEHPPPDRSSVRPNSTQYRQSHGRRRSFSSPEPDHPSRVENHFPGFGPVVMNSWSAGSGVIPSSSTCTRIIQLKIKTHLPEVVECEIKIPGEPSTDTIVTQ